MEPIYKFRKTRDGAYHSSLPARDLDEDDVKALDKEQLELLESSRLYRKIEPPEAEAPVDGAVIAPVAPSDPPALMMPNDLPAAPLRRN